MKKIEVYTNSDDVYSEEATKHEYNILSDGTLTEMNRSHNRDWSNPGENVITCIENDREGEYRIAFSDKKKKITLDYAEAQELFILLGIIQDMGVTEYRKSKVIKTYGK